MERLRGRAWRNIELYRRRIAVAVIAEDLPRIQSWGKEGGVM
jgi:hypothetical protein